MLSTLFYDDVGSPVQKYPETVRSMYSICIQSQALQHVTCAGRLLAASPHHVANGSGVRNAPWAQAKLTREGCSSAGKEKAVATMIESV